MCFPVESELEIPTMAVPSDLKVDSPLGWKCFKWNAFCAALRVGAAQQPVSPAARQGTNDF